MVDVMEPALRPLPDLLRDGLDIAFIGINPSIMSATQGHYFARPTNRFWPCFSRSTLSVRARQGLGVEILGPTHDYALLEFRIGFTDIVKRPSANASALGRTEFEAGAAQLALKLERYHPRIACFHGMTAYRPFHRTLTPGSVEHVLELGPQNLSIGRTQLFVVPNPSPANAHFTPTDQTDWYDRLAAFLQMTWRSSSTDFRTPSSGGSSMSSCSIDSTSS
jgi:TDG/mug DNA glycosylase family protein